MYLGEGLLPSPPVMGIIVEMRIGNGANVAWFADDMRVTWVPLTEATVRLAPVKHAPSKPVIVMFVSQRTFDP